MVPLPLPPGAAPVPPPPHPPPGASAELARVELAPLALPLDEPAAAAAAPVVAPAVAPAAAAPVVVAAAAAAAAAPADGEIAETGDVTIGGITMTSADCDVILGAVATAEEASQAAVQTKAVRKKWDTSTFFGRLFASGMCPAVRTRTALLEAIRALRGTRAAGNRQALMAGKYQTINLGGAGRDQRRFCVFPGCMCVVRGPWRDHITAHVQAIEATMEQGALKGAGAGGGGEVRIPPDLQATCRDLLQQAGGGGDDDSDPDAEAAAAAALALHHAQTDYNALQRFASERLRDDPAIVVAAT